MCFLELNHFINIEDSSSSVAVGTNASWLCVVNCVQTPTIQWLDKNNVPVPSSSNSVWTEKVIINDTVTHLYLYFNTISSSQGGTYTCKSSVVFPPSIEQDTINIVVECKLINRWNLKTEAYPYIFLIYCKVTVEFDPELMRSPFLSAKY